MLYIENIDVSESTDVTETSASKEFIRLYQYFIDKEFKFQPAVCSRCHDVLRMSMKLNDIVVLNIHSFNYLCTINEISKSEVANLLQKTDSSLKKWIIIKSNFSLQRIKDEQRNYKLLAILKLKNINFIIFKV